MIAIPFPHEHAARLKEPDDFDKDSFRRTEGGTIFGKIKVPKTIGIIWAKLKGKSEEDDPPIPQALRFPTKHWTADEAKKWMKDNEVKYIRFEPATGEKEKKQSESIPKVALTFREDEVGVVEFSADEEGKKEKRRFKMLAHSGKVMEGHWFWGNFAIDLQGVQIGRQKKPALRDHQSNRIVGWSEKIAKDEKGIHVEGVFCESTEDGQEALKLAVEGFPWQASIYIPPLVIERVSEGQEVEVNGYKLKGPGTVFRKSRLREVSFCALGADENTDAEALSDGNVTVEFVEEGREEDGMDYKEITLEQLKVARPDIVVSLVTEATNAGFKDGEEKGIKAEKDRVNNIFSAMPPGLEAVAILAVKEGLTPEEVKDKFLKEVKRNSPPSPGPADDVQPHQDLSGLSVEEKAKKEWESKPELRDEFADVKTYIAFKKADDKGLVKILEK